MRLIGELDKIRPETLEFLGTVITAFASLVGIVIAALLARFLAGIWLSARDKQDKEVEWRNHAIELSKLDLQRKLSIAPENRPPLRPCILDFLANYRDLQELGEKSPTILYQKIVDDRTTQIKSKTAEKEELPSEKQGSK